MDFIKIAVSEPKGKEKVQEVYADFLVGRAKDFMVRGQSFYAIWDEEAQMWLTDEFEVRRIIDKAVTDHVEQLQAAGTHCVAKLLLSYETGRWNQFRKYMKNIADNSHQLDATVTFADTPVKKTDYVTRRLPYALASGPRPAYDELMGTLYSDEERVKFEWAIGAIVAGESKKISKFIVFFGPPGHGKGTALEILKRLFPGYYATFEAKALVSEKNDFATAAFKENPLIGIDDDADMSGIKDNSVFNKIAEHNDIRLNEKFKPEYTTRINTFMFVGTNKPVMITDGKSGLIRRLIDIQPTGNLIPVARYEILMSQVDFELGAIAQHCLDTYRRMGRNYYSNYKPLSMMLKTDPFFNFVEAYYDIFKQQDSTTLTQSWEMYKKYNENAEIKYKYTQIKFREELKNYFEEYHHRTTVDGVQIRQYYRGFTAQPYKVPISNDHKSFSLVLDETVSLLDQEYAARPAQYAKGHIPERYWTDEERVIDGVLKKPNPRQVVATMLVDLDTSKVHFVKPPENHIVIDFDLKGEDGEKSMGLNLTAASEWPATYAELSMSGAGVHLHYIYDGDVGILANEYSPGIEIKVFGGNSALRRQLSKCNSVPIATINSGLPFKEKTTVLDDKVMKSEKTLRNMINRNLNKEIHPGTKPSMDFIKHLTDEAYSSGMVYDVNDMKPSVIAFANNSTNKAIECLRMVQQIKWASEPVAVEFDWRVESENNTVVLFDIEVFPNLFVVCWGYEDTDSVVQMINPTAQEVEALFKLKLVGFNNRKYDNHILWARYMGYNNAQLYELSQKLIGDGTKATFGEAYNLSYTDIYDYSIDKKRLKKWEIDLGIHHMELNIPWDEPVPEERWVEVTEYCSNDVVATRATWRATKADFKARQILAELSGLSVNHTTNTHTARIVFGKDRIGDIASQRVYTDLSQEFPGYLFDPYAKTDKSTYRGEIVGEGGNVYSEPGMYENVTLLDAASMHPTTIKVLGIFGEYTKNFVELMDARLAIKQAIKSGVFDEAKKIMGGRLAPYLGDVQQAKELSDALKLAINSVYGLTSAGYDNPFRDIRNVDNIVAKRGALFMIDLKNAVQAEGFKVVHIKTDSIKIPNATPEIVEFVSEFGRKYGYSFDNEGTYEKFCLVNDAVYIARKRTADGEVKWDAKGAEFQHPVVYKALFSGEPIVFSDLCETKQVIQGAMWLDFNEFEATPATPYEGMHFVGRTGSFVPVKKGAKLTRVKDDKVYAVSGTKGYQWLEAEMLSHLKMDDVKLTYQELLDHAAYTNDTDDGYYITDVVDVRYYENLVNDALASINMFGSYEEFVK